MLSCLQLRSVTRLLKLDELESAPPNAYGFPNITLIFVSISYLVCRARANEDIRDWLASSWGEENLVPFLMKSMIDDDEANDDLDIPHRRTIINSDYLAHMYNVFLLTYGNKNYKCLVFVTNVFSVYFRLIRNFR